MLHNLTADRMWGKRSGAKVLKKQEFSFFIISIIIDFYVDNALDQYK